MLAGWSKGQWCVLTVEHAANDGGVAMARPDLHAQCHLHKVPVEGKKEEHVDYGD